MQPDTTGDEVLSDSRSTSSSRRNSTVSNNTTGSNLANHYTRPRRGSVTDAQRPPNMASSSLVGGRRPSVTMDANDLTLLTRKQSSIARSPPPLAQQEPVKVLVFNGKCSKVFKSTLEECVEDCILEFPGENSIYVPKNGQPIQLPPGTRKSSVLSIKDPGVPTQTTSKSIRRRSSTTLFNMPQIGAMRTNPTSTLTLPGAAVTATSATRMRHTTVSQKFSLAENISEETTDQKSAIEEETTTAVAAETEERSRHPTISVLPEETVPIADVPSRPSSSRRRPIASPSYLERQKDYRLSDLVMLGPEYFAHIFNLPRNTRPINSSQSTRRRSSTRRRGEKLSAAQIELERIKQDLFHRYLWTQKPQVSCRIRPISTYSRSATFVT